MGRDDLARKVPRVSEENGDDAGYSIHHRFSLKYFDWNVAELAWRRTAGSNPTRARPSGF